MSGGGGGGGSGGGGGTSAELSKFTELVEMKYFSVTSMNKS